MLSDDTIILRALEPDDLDVLYRWENDTSLWSVGTTIAPFSRKQLWDYIATYDNDLYSARQPPAHDGEPRQRRALGTIDLCDFDPANARMSVGILVDPVALPPRHRHTRPAARNRICAINSRAASALRLCAGRQPPEPEAVRQVRIPYGGMSAVMAAPAAAATTT